MICLTTLFLFIFHYGIHSFCNYYIPQYQTISNQQSMSKQQHFICQDVISICMSSVVCFLFFIELISYNNIFNIHERWNQKISTTIHMSFSMLVSNSLYELVLYLLFGKKLTFYIHHILVCLIYSWSLYLQELSFFLCLCGFVEITNIFLCTITILSRLQLREQYKKVYQCMGIGLYLSYLITRVIMFLCSFLLFIYDLLYYPNLTIMTHHVVYLCFVVIAFLLLYTMSFYWFLIIHEKLRKRLKHYKYG